MGEGDQVRKIRAESNGEKALVSMTVNDFEKRTIPIKAKSPKDLFLFQCGCGCIHFRHAGYIESLMPYMRADKSKHVSEDSESVLVCTKCRKCYVWVNNQMWEITDLIDLHAWEKTEKEMHKMTGPGGNC